jgi:hypothetical protein
VVEASRGVKTMWLRGEMTCEAKAHHMRVMMQTCM